MQQRGVLNLCVNRNLPSFELIQFSMSEDFFFKILKVLPLAVWDNAPAVNITPGGLSKTAGGKMDYPWRFEQNRRW